MAETYRWGDCAPFLAIALKYGADYGHVLAWADVRQREMMLRSIDRPPWSYWENRAYDAIVRRPDLRAAISMQVEAWIRQRGDIFQVGPLLYRPVVVEASP